MQSLPRRVAAQFRRHCHFSPGLWNLYFRDHVNEEASLAVGARSTPKQPQEHVEQDATMAASALYDILHNGFYHTTEGARHPIAGDLTKIPFPAGIAAQQNRLLADFRFRTRLVPATQGIPTTLGHIRSVLDNYPVWQ